MVRPYQVPLGVLGSPYRKAVRGGLYALKGKTENVFRNQGPKYSRIERSLSAVSLTAIRCKLYLGQLGLSAVSLTATRCKLYLVQLSVKIR